jgi:N-acetyl-gamma-glutamyl-phosphate reductase
MFRGILAVNTAKLVSGVSKADLRSAFENAYSAEKYIELLPEEVSQTPKTLRTTTALLLALQLTKLRIE